MYKKILGLRGTVGAGFGRFKLLRDAYHKPMIYDEVGYEGNLVQGTPYYRGIGGGVLAYPLEKRLN